MIAVVAGVTKGCSGQRLCENYFQKLNVVIRDSFIAVFA
jgi:hypothetical protein